MNRPNLDRRRVLITGGTGSIGGALCRRFVSGDLGRPEEITVLSRDEFKQFQMRMEFGDNPLIRFRVGDVRDRHTLLSAMRRADVVFHVAALKHVPVCERNPIEAVMTNVVSASNIVSLIDEHALPIESVVSVSTDKACNPFSTMGATKFLAERIFVEAASTSKTRFSCVRFGNVVASRGSIIPIWADQIAAGGPLTLTDPTMTRFFISMREATDLIMDGYGAPSGSIVIPRAKSARIVDVADVLNRTAQVPLRWVGIRPGERIHEEMVSDDELRMSSHWNGRILLHGISTSAEKRAYSSADHLMSDSELYTMFSPFAPQVAGVVLLRS